MRCNRHFSDHSSGVGVCASCLREKLFTLVAAQTRQIQHQQFQAQEDRRKSDVNRAPLVFPRSVSPYISRQTSDTSSWRRRHRHDNFADQRFCFTPQLGPNGMIVEGNEYSEKKKNCRSLFYNMFRSKSDKPDSDPALSNSGEPCAETPSTASWFSSIIGRRRKKKHRTFSIDESTTGGMWRSCRNLDRGLSPARYSDYFIKEQSHGVWSGYSSESSQGWKQTPRRTPALATGLKSGERSRVPRNVSGMAFCLSPLVRASPNRQWNQKSVPPELLISGDIRAPASLCKNGSRKLVDFGRVNRNHRYC